MNEINDDKEILTEEMQKTIALLRDNYQNVADRTHLHTLLNNLEKKPIQSPYSNFEKFFTAFKFIAPVGVVAAIALLVTTMQMDGNKVAVVTTPTPVVETPDEIKTSENVDAIVHTVYKTTVKENSQATATARVAEDKNLALRDKDVINSLATNYDDAF